MVSSVVGVLIVVVVYLCANLRTTRRGAVRIASTFRMRQVVRALDAYYASFGALPPRILMVSTKNGTVRHSWRAALLPYLVPPEVASRYELSKSWDDEGNLKTAREIDAYSVSKGKSDLAYFAVSDAKRNGIGSNRSAIRIVAIPDRPIIWSTPEDVTSEEVWNAIVQEPELVLADIQGGCIIPFGKLVKTQDECRGWLGVSPTTRDQQWELHRRIVSSNSVSEARKKCSKDILKEGQ